MKKFVRNIIDIKFVYQSFFEEICSPFESEDSLSDVGGKEYFVKLTRFSSSVKQSIDYAKIIHEKFVKRELVPTAGKPIIEIMTINFLLVALDQLVNHAAKIRYMSANQYAAPFMVRTVTGGGAQLGATHSQCFEPWLASVPGLKVVAPSSPYDALGLFRSAIKEKDPIVFVEHILLYGSKGIVDEDYYEIPIGKANVVRSGDNLTLVAYSKMVPLCIEVANTLEEQGIDVEVIDLRSLRPCDKETIINSVNKTNRLVIVEEAWRSGGFGAEIASTVQEEAFDSLDGPIGRVGGLEVPMPYTSVLESQVIPSKDRIIEYIHQNLNT